MEIYPETVSLTTLIYLNLRRELLILTPSLLLYLFITVTDFLQEREWRKKFPGNARYGRRRRHFPSRSRSLIDDEEVERRRQTILSAPLDQDDLDSEKSSDSPNHSAGFLFFFSFSVKRIAQKIYFLK